MLCFIETSLFTKRVKALMNDDDFREFQEFLCLNPRAGPVIAGSGGIRKIRWQRQNHGKRGGVRIMYYWSGGSGIIRLLFIFAKGEQDNLTHEQLKMLRSLIETW